MFLVFAAPSYWFGILPLCWLVIRASACRYGGILTGVLLAGVIPIVTLFFDELDFSWRGTLSIHHVFQLMVPLLFLSIYGYHLLRRYLKQQWAWVIVPWFSQAALLTSGSLCLLFLLGFAGLLSYYNSPPRVAPVNWTVQDNRIKGRVMLEAQQHVINTLLEQRQAILREDGAYPVSLLENSYAWQRGVEEQVKSFSGMLNYTSFFMANPVKSTRRQPQVEFLLETPPDLKKANEQARTAYATADPELALNLYRQALDGIALANQQLIETSIHVKGMRRLKWYIQDAAAALGAPAYELQVASDRINRALEPDRYSPRKPARVAIQPLWSENDALYEMYGSAWALGIYLDAIEIEHRDKLEAAGALTLLQRARQALSQCQPWYWSPMVLFPAGIDALQEELRRAYSHASEALTALYELRDILPR